MYRPPVLGLIPAHVLSRVPAPLFVEVLLTARQFLGFAIAAPMRKETQLKVGSNMNCTQHHTSQLHTRLLGLLRSSCDVADVTMLFVEFHFDEHAAASAGRVLNRPACALM